MRNVKGFYLVVDTRLIVDLTIWYRPINVKLYYFADINVLCDSVSLSVTNRIHVLFVVFFL